MSRSRNKNFVSPNLACGDNQSKWKKAYNRMFRRKSKIHLDTSIDENGEVIKDYFHRDLKKRDFADVYSSPADGFHRVEMLTRSEYNRIVQEQNGLVNSHFPKFIRDKNIKSYDDYVDYFNKTYRSK